VAVKIACAQFVSSDDKEESLQRIEAKIAEAAAEGAQLVAFHELATTSYFCFDRDPKYFSLAEPIPGPSTERVAKAAEKHGIHVMFPLYEQEGETRWNTATLIEPGKGVAGIYRKSHVPTSRAHSSGQKGADEAFFFDAGNTGFNVWESSLGLRIGVLICYDRHFPEGARSYGLQDVDLIFAPTASYRRFIIETLWEAELQSIAFQQGCYVAGINKVGPVYGAEGDNAFPGRSVIIDAEGKILARADDQEGLVMAEVDHDLAVKARETLRFMQYRRPDFYGALVEPVKSPASS
jgi:beta-ureidopropionase